MNATCTLCTPLLFIASCIGEAVWGDSANVMYKVHACRDEQLQEDHLFFYKSPLDFLSCLPLPLAELRSQQVTLARSKLLVRRQYPIPLVDQK